MSADRQTTMTACAVCGAPATAFYNTASAATSSVPDNIQPVCDAHNPMARIITVKPQSSHAARPATRAARVAYPGGYGSCGEYLPVTCAPGGATTSDDESEREWR